MATQNSESCQVDHAWTMMAHIRVGSMSNRCHFKHLCYTRGILQHIFLWTPLLAEGDNIFLEHALPHTTDRKEVLHGEYQQDKSITIYNAACSLAFHLAMKSTTQTKLDYVVDPYGDSLHIGIPVNMP